MASQHCLQEVVVSGSSEDECMHLWDLGTATTLVSYRPAAPASSAAVAPIGRDFFAIAQAAKASLHVFQVPTHAATPFHRGPVCGHANAPQSLLFFTLTCSPSVVSMQWRRDQPHARMALPERLVAIAATADGAHIAGGAESGRIYLWEACSGTLFLMCVRACTVSSTVFTSSLFYPTWSPHCTLPAHLPVRRRDAAILGGAL